MNTQLEQILRLPVSERIRLVEDIWDSIAAVPESVRLTPKQMKEIEHRLEDYRADPENVVSWEEVKNKLGLSA